MLKSKALIGILDAALDLEVEGKLFYYRCAAETRDERGRSMFNYLAGEEEDHYAKVEKIYRAEFNKEYSEYKEKRKASIPESGVFKRKVSGGEAGEKADALDALNIALITEENSIMLYNKIWESAKSPRLKKVFARILSEEGKHLAIIKEAIESVTKTGSYYDFKVVTS